MGQVVPLDHISVTRSLVAPFPSRSIPTLSSPEDSTVGLRGTIHQVTGYYLTPRQLTEYTETAYIKEMGAESQLGRRGGEPPSSKHSMRQSTGHNSNSAATDCTGPVAHPSQGATTGEYCKSRCL